MKTSGTGALCKTRMGQNVTFDGTLRPNPAIALPVDHSQEK